MVRDPRHHVEAVVGVAIGKPCFSVIVGRDEEEFVLDLGGRLSRSLRLANHRLSFLQRTFEGEFGFLVECAWRLDGPTGMVAARFGGRPEKDPPEHPLHRLESRRLLGATVQHAGFDLSLAFEGDYELHCLSTETNQRSRRCNWSFWYPGGSLTVASGGRIEERSLAELEAEVEAARAASSEESVLDTWKQRWGARKPADESKGKDRDDPGE